MAQSAMLVVHITAGGLALLSGAAALVLRKGERPHRAAGTVFFVSMLAVAGLGSAIAAQIREPFALIPGLVTLHLVATAWAAVRRPEGRTGRFEPVASAAGFGVAALGVGFGMQGSPGAPVLYMFAALAGFAAALDLRVVRRGGVAGADRIARHLWRMCAALAIAGFSFFLGQQDEFPAALRGPHLALPPLAVLGAMIFWLVRVRGGPGRMAAATPAPPR